MVRLSDILLTALAPAIWGSTYYVTTEFLPQGYPITMAALRALPAGLLLLLLVRRLPSREWVGRIFLLGAFNFAIFWVMLFVAAYRLPGGVAAIVGAVQPLFVIFIAFYLIKTPIFLFAVISAIGGIFGVALLLLGPSAALDPIGIIAGLAGALSMAFGTVLSRKWKPPVSLLTFTAWQLSAGGLLLLPLAYFMEPALPPLTSTNILGIAYLGLIGAALTYYIWFRGVGLLAPSAVSTLGFLSPTTAVILGWVLLDESLTPVQMLGVGVVLASIWVSQMAGRKAPAPKPA
ncbi:EamA family transporter [Pseudovibrio exalbescens]|uniref:EamA family transporter n=1 Tax=Pseudovibrio exalbescens TaxID=197461 RepID=UPI002365D12C|nr:EamA family transporter [Pseudovibrio exalbescens]MDD7911454.1 EamA family transporter [Pseudovibrio exalbescens]